MNRKRVRKVAGFMRFSHVEEYELLGEFSMLNKPIRSLAENKSVLPLLLLPTILI